MKRICFLILFACVCSPAFSWNGGGWLQNQTVDDLTVVGDILPAQDNTSDLGSSANSFKNLYIDGNIYGSSGSAIGGWTSATGKIYLTTATDNVGMGTSAPTVKLEVVGAVKASSFSATGTDANTTLDDIYIDGNDNTTAGVMRMGGVGNTNNESIDLDFETTADKVKISSASNVYALNYQLYNIGQVVTDVINNSVGSTQTIITRGFADDTFLDEEEFLIPTGGVGLAPNATGFGSAGVDSFEASNWTTLNSDLQFPTMWTTTQMDNDGGTPGSPSGDHSEQSSDDKHSGTYSFHFVTDDAYESVKINSSVIVPSGYWYRSQLWTKEVSGSLVTTFPNWSTYWNGNDNGCCRQSPPTGSWAYNGGDWYFPAGATISTYSLVMSTFGEAYFDDVSLERVSPIEGVGEVWAGTEYAKFLISNSSSVIDDGEDAWDEQVVANVTATADNTTYQVGAAAAKFAVADGFTTGVIGSEVISVDTAIYDAMSVTVRSSVDLAGGDYRVVFDDSANSASPSATLNLPVMTANTWYTFLISLQGETNLPAAAISLGLRQNADKGAMNFWIDDVKLIKYGQVTILDHTTNVANSDTDGNLCVYDKAGFITPAIKNRLGSTKSMTAILKYREVQ